MSKQIDELAAKLTKAVRAADAAEEAVTGAREILVSRSREVGLLLLEAKKLHPSVKDFEAFLKRIDGLKLSRAYDMLRLAGGRITHEELKKDARERKQKSRRRGRIKLPQDTCDEVKKLVDSVTDPPVTESPEASAEKRKAEYADLSGEEKKEAEFADFLDAQERAQKESAHYFAEFTAACRMYLPKITERNHRDKVHDLVDKLMPRNYFNKVEAA
jgi:hypothetical protein